MARQHHYRPRRAFTGKGKNGVTNDERLRWAEARLDAIQRLAHQHPTDETYRAAVAAQQQEVEQCRYRVANGNS